MLSCEDFTIFIRTTENLGNSVDCVEFTSEQWQLLEALSERLDAMNPKEDSLAYQLSCMGQKQIVEWV